MNTKNLSTVANEVIADYGVINMNVINAYRFGGERMLGIVDQRFADTVNRGTALSKELRANVIDSQKRVSGYFVKGLQIGSDRAHSAVGVAVDLASKGVNIVATNADRLDRSTNLNALDKLNRAVMPAANVIVQLVERIEQGSGKLVQLVSGKDMPANAIATRSLKTSTRKAAAVRKQVTKQVTKTVTKAQRTATKRVSTVVAKTATKTSNAARRVARKASSVAAAA